MVIDPDECTNKGNFGFGTLCRTIESSGTGVMRFYEFQFGRR
jgi:hypothetical protein